MKGPVPKQFKVCPACGIEKPRHEFYKKLTSISRLCKPCTLADNKARKHLYVGKYQEYQNQWRRDRYATDPEYRQRLSEQKKRYWQSNKDAQNAKRREEWASNPYCAARKHNRWRDIKDRCPPWADWRAMMDFYAKCPDGYEVDHIIPLKGLIDGRPVSGLHVPWNLQYLTVADNRKKYNKVSESDL